MSLKSCKIKSVLIENFDLVKIRLSKALMENSKSETLPRSLRKDVVRMMIERDHTIEHESYLVQIL